MHIDAPPASGLPSATDSEMVAALLRRLDRPVVLVGMMGVGKTSLGRRLATVLGVDFCDADEEIEAAAQMTIPEIFAAYDEPYFRAGERRVIARLIGDTPEGVAPGPRLKVIATGGGAFCHAETRALILRRGIAIWLDADLDTLVERTARKANRPLLQAGDPREILARLKREREGHYAQAPIHVKSGVGPPQRLVMQAIGAVLAWLDPAPAAPA